MEKPINNRIYPGNQVEQQQFGAFNAAPYAQSSYNYSNQIGRHEGEGELQREWALQSAPALQHHQQYTTQPKTTEKIREMQITVDENGFERHSSPTPPNVIRSIAERFYDVRSNIGNLALRAFNRVARQQGNTAGVGVPKHTPMHTTANTTTNTSSTYSYLLSPGYFGNIPSASAEEFPRPRETGQVPPNSHPGNGSMYPHQ